MDSMEMLFVSGSRRTSIWVSERPGSPGTMLLSEPISRMFIGSSGRGTSISSSAAAICVRSSGVLAAVPASPRSDTKPLAYPTARPGVASTTTTTATPTSLNAR